MGDAECVSQSLSGLSVTHHRQDTQQWEQKKDIVQQMQDNDWSPEPKPLRTFPELTLKHLKNCQFNYRTVR